MPVIIDPEGTEITALLDYTGSLAGKHVLEVGAGKGRLMWQYADQAAHVTALEPDPDSLAVAREDLPDTLYETVTLIEGGIEDFHQHPPAQPFDVVIMARSL